MSIPRPTIPKPTPWAFPRHDEFFLDNGVRVWAFDLPGQLVLRTNLALDLPLTAEPTGMEGIAALAAEVADEGTTNYPGETFAERVEGHGISLHSGAHWEATMCGAQVTVSQFAKALQLLTELVNNPEYRDRDIARHIEDELVEIADLEANPGARVATAMSRALVSSTCRSATRGSGTRESVARITPELVREFHDAYWTPAGATFVVAGSLPSDLRSLLNDTISTWQGPQPSVTHEKLLPNESSSPLWLIDHPGAPQATLRVGALTPTRDHPDWAQAQVACTAMGGTFGSRLNARLREDRGYTYGASCHIAPQRFAGIFTAGLNCRTEVAADALHELLALLDLADGPFTAPEIDAARDYRIGVSPLSYDNAGAIAHQAAVFASHAIAPAWFNDFQRSLQETTPDRATEVFATWLAPEKRHIVIAGDAKQLLPTLRAKGFDPELVGTFG
ncbi:MAG: insulinase family protein [Propionibacteriaceae bacterium]|jgi:predicted Zn-dependent peptidase|nr:insulinase family protein [Propionibacteriaceae bacterium]